MIPSELLWPSERARAHWRELKGRPSYQCESVLGQLFDEVLQRTRSRETLRMATIALAGRRVDKCGTIIVSANDRGQSQFSDAVPYLTKELYLERAPYNAVKEVQPFANSQRDLYEDEYLQILNKYGVRSEGEAATGCIRKYHKLQKKRQHDFSEEIRRNIRGLRQKYRRIFFRRVLSLVRERAQETWISVCEPSTQSSENAKESVQADEEGEHDDDEYSYEEEDDIVFNESDYDSEEDVQDDPLIEWAENVATARRAIVPSQEQIEWSMMYPTGSIRKWAGYVAAAYYDAVYSPAFKWDEQRTELYSFPWIVVGDVIACLRFNWEE